jgi:hypothetical protein
VCSSPTLLAALDEHVGAIRATVAARVTVRAADAREKELDGPVVVADGARRKEDAVDGRVRNPSRLPFVAGLGR